MFFNAFRQVGNDLFTAGLNNSHSGNLSIKLDPNYMIITRTGSMLHHLEHQHLITTGIANDDDNTPLASRDRNVHSSIYMYTHAKAIVHAHSPRTVAFSMSGEHVEDDSLILKDAEGCYFFPDGVKIVEAENTIASDEVADLIIPAFEVAPIVILKGHGIFAIGKTLEEAYHWTATLEHSAKILRFLGK